MFPGNLTMSITFNKPLNLNVTVLCLGEFSENLAISYKGAHIKPSYNTNQGQS